MHVSKVRVSGTAKDFGLHHIGCLLGRDMCPAMLHRYMKYREKVLCPQSHTIEHLQEGANARQRILILMLELWLANNA